MLAFKEMRLEAYRRDNGEAMISLHARDPVVPVEDGTGGIRFLSFYFTEREFCDLLEGKIGSCNDIGHNVRRAGELYTFYDMEYPREPSGVMRVPYVNINIPNYVAVFLVRLAKKAWAKAMPGAYERIELHLTWEVRERWLRLYGQGKGKVDLACDERTQAFLDECQKADASGRFAERIESLKQIASNTTWKHTHKAAVNLSKDLDGFYFRIMTPEGRCTLNGGLINHGRDGKPDWSLHT